MRPIAPPAPVNPKDVLPPDVITEKFKPQTMMHTKVRRAVYIVVVLFNPALYIIMQAMITPVIIDAITMMEYTGKVVVSISICGVSLSIKKV